MQRLFRRTIYAALVGTMACAPPPRAPTCPPAAAAVAPIVVAPAPGFEPLGPTARRREGLCWAKGRPRARPPGPKKDDPPFCAPIDAKELPRVEARLRKDFVIHARPSKLVVDFGCDLAAGATKDVFFEEGSGHGGTLRIVRMHRRGDRYALRMIASSHHQDAQTKFLAAEIDAPRVDLAIARSRVALLAQPHLILLSDRSSGLGLSGSGSSNDFHLRISIVDEAGQITDRRFTDYETSDTQKDYLPLRLGAEPIEKLVATVPFAPAEITGDDRSMFTERFLATMAERPAWWIRERYVTLAASFGTIDAVPALASLLEAKDDPSDLRAREEVLDAITAITGWNPRLDARGARRSVEEASAIALRECAP